MKVPAAATAALAVACLSSHQTSLFASAFVPLSSTKSGTRCASIVIGGGSYNSNNQSSHSILPASADESSTASTSRRPEWSPSSWRDVKDDEVGGEEDESIIKAAKKISK